MNVVEKAERALETLVQAVQVSSAARHHKSYEVQNATSTLGRCLGALGSRSNYTRDYANLLHSAVPTLLSLASSDSAEVRLAGDEALNRAFVGGYPFHAYKINITLQNQIDYTKNARWIRAALSRVCLGNCWLRPGVGKIRGQAQTLFPKMTQIVKHSNDSLQLIIETLENNLPRILKALAEYTTDEEIFDLAKELFRHVESSEPPVRRGAAACVASLCQHRHVLVTDLLHTIVGKLWPEASESNVINGWFGVIKSLLQLNSMNTMKESGVFTVYDYMELYQLCINYIESPKMDHNTYNTVMECLYLLVSQATGEFKHCLLDRHPKFVAIGSRAKQNSHLHRRSANGVASVMSNVSTTSLSEEGTTVELSEQLSFSGALYLGSLSQLQTPRRSVEDLTLKTPDSPTSDVNVDLSNAELSKHLAAKLEGIQDDEEMRIEYEEPGTERENVLKINIGTSHDDDIPLRYCARLLTSKFILSGNKGGVISDRNVRVSVKASALNCLSAVMLCYPQAITMWLDKDADMTAHNISGSSEGAESQENANDFILERNVCYQDSLTDSFTQELLNKSVESHSHANSQSVISVTSKREHFKSNAESIDQKSSNKDVPSNILDSKMSKNDLLASGQSADSTNPNMSISNFTSNSNMTVSNDAQSTEYPISSSGDFLSSSLDLDMKFDHFGESTSNIENFDALNLTKPPRKNTSEETDELEKLKRPLRRTDEVQSKDFPEDKGTANSEENNETANNERVEFDNQHMTDVFILLEDHIDPQIRGLVRLAIGNYLFSVLDLSHGDYTRWRHFSALPKDVIEKITAYNLVEIIIKGLSDEIHSCVNHSLTAISKIFTSVTISQHTSLLAQILNALVQVENNSYWLCKVNLCKLYENLPYMRLSIVCPDYASRSTLIMEVLFRLLADQDQKVRKAASSAIAETIPKLRPSKCKSENAVLIQLAKEQSDHFSFAYEDLALNLVKNTYFQHDLPEQLKENGEKSCANLGYVVSEFVCRLMEASCKFYTLGLLEGLVAVCKRWKPSCHIDSYLGTGITSFCLDTLDCCNNSVTSCIALLDIATAVYPVEVWEAMHNKRNGIFERDSEAVRERWQHLETDKCRQLAEKFIQITLKVLNILMHLIEEINPNAHLNKTGIALPGSPVRRKTQDSIPRRGSTASDVEDHTALRKKPQPLGGTNVRANFVGQFVNEPFYMKLYDNLKAAYSNHKINLDPNSSMFQIFVSSVLDALAVQLELSNEKELGPVTEEILYYLKVILPLKADKTVLCVTQLLKTLFGTNMANQYNDYMNIRTNANNKENVTNFGFFEEVIMFNSFKCENHTENEETSRRSSVSSNFSQKLKMSIEAKNPQLVKEKQLLEKMELLAKNKSDIKWNTNKKELERYIRLFEPVVMQALRTYTMQNDIPLQCKVLGLLNQLLTLRVNYCMLDSDQVFIGFLLKQLDLVEQNEIPDCRDLVNSIMIFLVQLSSSKHHTKQLMDIPKLIQLCDGLMASARLSECISALEPLACRVFWSTSSAPAQHQETQVTREVLFSMLHKTMSDPEVLDIISAVLSLSQSHIESYYRWSELTSDALLNLLTQRTIGLNSRRAISSLERMIDCVYKDVLLEQSRVEILLKILFSQPPEQNSASLEQKVRYLATIMIILRKILIHIPESEIILTINYLKATFISPSSIFFNIKTDIDPLNVHNVNENCANLSPDVVLVRFLFKTLTYVILEIEKCDEVEYTEFEREDSNDEYRLLYCIAVNIICQVKHMLHLSDGCLFPLTAKTAQSVLQNEQSGLNTGLYTPEENIPLEKLNLICVRESHRIPLLTVHWCHLLIRLKFLEQKYWHSLLGYMRSSPLSPENGKGQVQVNLLQIGCVMAYCEYFVENGLSEAIHLTWLLVNRVHILVTYYKEPVVRRLIEKVNDNSSSSGLLLQAVAARCQGCIKDEFALNTYLALSKVHNSQSGSLVFLICRIVGKLAPSIGRRFSQLAVSRCRKLKTLPAESISVQLSKEDVQVALELLQRDKCGLRYSSLVVELNALASAVFDLSPLDLSQDRTINPQYIVTTNVDGGWLVNQIKNRCYSASNEPSPRIDKLQDLATMLLNLSTEELALILACPEFDRRILHACFTQSCDKYLKEFLKVLAVYESKEIEKKNIRKQKEQQKREETATSNTDNNILNVASSLKFKKNDSESKSQFFIPISENKETFEQKFGNLELSEDDPNDVSPPDLPDLFIISLTALEKSITSIIRQFPKQNRPLSQSENFNLTSETIDRYTKRCHQVFQDKLFYQEYCVVQDILTGYLDALHKLYAFLDDIDCDISEKIIDKILPSSIAKCISNLTVISLQYLSFLIKNKNTVESPAHSDVSFRTHVTIDRIVVDNMILLTLRNASDAFSFKDIWCELNVEFNANRVQSAISCLYAVMKYSVKDTEPLILKKYVRAQDDSCQSDFTLTCDKLLTLIEYFEVNFYAAGNTRYGQIICEQYRRCIELLLIAFSRLDLVCNVALIPPLAWPGVDLAGKTEQFQKIDLPLQALQDMDVLVAFLFRVNFIGWSSKKVFEEIWMALLGALQGNGTHWAVRGIMQLLLSTIPAVRRQGRPRTFMMHCTRDQLDDSYGIQRMKSIVFGQPIYSSLFEHVNMERIPFMRDQMEPAFQYGQFNTEFLRLASGISDDASFRVKMRLKCMRRNTDIDVNSCLQLLMDVASQMLQLNAPTGLAARCALLSCIIHTSCLFTDGAEWSWLTQSLTRLTNPEYRPVTQHALVSQYLLCGLSTAFTVLHGTGEPAEVATVYQKLVKSLTSNSAPLRQCALHGCLLQLSARHEPCPSYKELVSQLSHAVKQNLTPNYRISLYEQSLHWTVLFKLVELGHTELVNIAVVFLLNNTTHPCADLVVKGITSAIRTSVLPKDLKKSIVENLVENRTKYLEKHSIQVLMVHLFSADNKLLSPRLTTDVSNMDPDVLMTSMERITLLYKVLRESSCTDTKLISAETLKYFLRETLPPAATLSRVVIEFVESCRETERCDGDREKWIRRTLMNAEVVFEVFQTAVSQSQLPILTGWIFEALCHLLGGKISDKLLPYALLCLLVSASHNVHMRKLSPLTFHTLRLGFQVCDTKCARNDSRRNLCQVHSRMSFADRRLLCIVALHSDFTKVQLDKLRELCEDSEVFRDLMRCLLSA